VQLLEIAATVLAHVPGDVRNPAPYPKLPRLGCMVIVKHNPTLQASVVEVAPTVVKKVDDSASSKKLSAPKLPANLSLSPHVHRSLILDSLTAVSWFGRNVAAKLHLLSDLAELLQTSFDDVYTSSLTAEGLGKMLARILQACMLHRQRDRKKCAKKLETLRAAFFDNRTQAAAEFGADSVAAAENHDEKKDPSPPVTDEDPTFLWSSIERLERLKESVREVGRLHPYSEMFLRIVQCYELPAVDVADTVADVLLPYVCQALKECNPTAVSTVTSRPAPREDALPPPAPVHVPQVAVQSDNILGEFELTDAPGEPVSVGTSVALTVDPEAVGVEEVLELDADGNLQPVRKKRATITVKKAMASELRAKKMAKVRARAEEQKRAALVAHLAHLDALASRRAALQVEALERKRLNETLDEEEAWWVLFMKNLLAGLRGKDSGMSELAAALARMAQSCAEKSAHLPLEVEVRDNILFNPPTPQTHSYAMVQAEAVALSFAYKFSIGSLNQSGVDAVVKLVRQRLTLLVRLAEEGVTQPLEIVTRGVLVHEYEALRGVFEHAVGLAVVSDSPSASSSSSVVSAVSPSSSSSSSRAGLSFLSDLHRSLVPSISLHFHAQLTRWLQESWTIRGMVSIPPSSVDPPDEERFVTCCRFFGLFRPLAAHYLRQASAALGEETVQRVMASWIQLRGSVVRPDELEGRQSTEESTEDAQPGRSKLAPEVMHALTGVFESIPPPSLAHAAYAQSALLSSSQYLQYLECEQAQTEVEVMVSSRHTTRMADGSPWRMDLTRLTLYRLSLLLFASSPACIRRACAGGCVVSRFGCAAL
jgi:hypothetical protein